jgi:hypothetical protein
MLSGHAGEKIAPDNGSFFQEEKMSCGRLVNKKENLCKTLLGVVVNLTPSSGFLMLCARFKTATKLPHLVLNKNEAEAASR